MNINDYFLQMKDKISYMELKDKSKYNIDFHLPIYMDYLVENIHNKSFENEINIKFFIDGIVKNFAIHNNFIHEKKYIDFLNSLNIEYEKFIFQDSIKKLNDESLLNFRGLYKINSDNLLNATFYGKSLFKKSFDIDDIKLQNEFISESIKVLENVLSKDEKFTLAIDALGDIYSSISFYKKADLFYEKAQNMISDELVKEEIRKKRDFINPKVNIENAIEKLNKYQYKEAINILNNTKKISKLTDLDYWLGVAYQGEGDHEKSIEYFKKSLDTNLDKETINDLSISYYLIGEIENAIKILEDGLKKYPENENILFNLFIMWEKYKGKSKSKKYLEKLKEMYIHNEEIRNEVNKLEL